MKRFLVLLLVGSLVMALMPAGASAAKKKKKKKKPPQVVEASIALPARHPDGCYAGLSRHAWSLFGEASNGVLGHTFDIEKHTQKRNFVLEPTGGIGSVDLDIVFYFGEFASQEDWLYDPLPPAPGSTTFETRDGGGEAGKVPEGAVKAIVCIYASEAGAAADVPFKYEAGHGVKIPAD